ncbi:MAG TPA: peptidylprolyl isomerase [Bacteroidota bacterium]|jgi:peptidyl-prolyl cis-trans isomerase SurA
MRKIIAPLLLCVSITVQSQVLDRVLAVVGDDIVLQSELDNQVLFYVQSNKLTESTPEIRDQVFQSMINEKLIVAKAIEDSVVVSDDEVQQQLDGVIKENIQRVGSEARLEELYGMPISRIKREFREQMRKNLLANRLQQQRFGSTSVTKREVEEFYQTYNDSIGKVPEEVELSHIYIKPKFNAEEKELARQKLQSLVDSIKAGIPFEDLARRHSEDPGSAPEGGDLGFVRRGQFVKEFETAAFALKAGETSGIVETDFGLHVIQLLERRGDAVHARHILIRMQRTPESDTLAIAFLDSLKVKVLAGESFAELARRYSEAKESAALGGYLGKFDLESQVQRDLYPVIVNLKEGEISEPARLENGFHIVLMKRRIPEHVVSLDQDYSRLEALAMNFKRNREYLAWIAELRTSIYWKQYL